MIRTMIFLLLSPGYFFSSNAQEARADTQLSRLIKIELGGQGLGFTYEPRLSNKMTLAISAGLGGGYEIGEGSLEVNYGEPSLYVSLTPKYYYNRERRIQKGKETLLNAGNYVGMRVKLTRGDIYPSATYFDGLLANLHWGIQRALGGQWTFNFHIGAGYAQNFDANDGTIYPAVDFAFSYVFRRSKK